MRIKKHIVLIIALLSGIACAQSPTTKPASKINPELPTLFLVGDSTVHNGTKGQQGWGEPIKALFDTTKINVENRAMGGRSSRTFRTEGRWEKALADAKAGDFVIMQLGHNDSGPLSEDDRNRGTIRGGGEETQEVTKPDGTSETVHTYGWYMRQYCIEAKAKGMTAIVCSYIPRCPKSDAKDPDKKPTVPSEPTSYALWSKEAAVATGADFVDLNKIILQHYAEFTPAELKTKFFTDADFTHTNPDGAKLNAECVVEGLKQINSTLTKYLRTDSKADAR